MQHGMTDLDADEVDDGIQGAGKRGRRAVEEALRPLHVLLLPRFLPPGDPWQYVVLCNISEI